MSNIILRGLHRLKNDPRSLWIHFFRTTIGKCFPDAAYLKIMNHVYMHKPLNLKDPQTFNEKLQWLKLHDRKPEYTAMVDKYEAKQYVASVIGQKYIIPTLGVWESFDEIDFMKLPNQFVLKCTHDSGSVIICRDKSRLNFEDAQQKITACLKRNYYWIGREWPYKNVKPRIIAEKYIVDDSGYELKDYKVFCFSGKPKVIQVDYDRFDNHRRNLYDTEWNYLGYTTLYPTDPKHVIEKPLCLNKLLECAAKLSAGIPFVRVDFYVVDNSPFFGEMTFSHGGGMEPFYPKEWDMKLGKYIELPK